MKRTLFLLTLLSCIAYCEAQVGIGTTTPSNASVLDLNSYVSSTKYGAFLPPRVTLTQRNLIPVTAADDGMMAYVSGFPNGERCLQLFNGTTLTWVSIQCFSAVVAFSETMGSVSSNTNTSVHTGYDHYGSCTYSSSTSSQSQVRIITPVSNATISTASGGAYVYFANGNRDFLISGINISAYTAPLTLQLLMYKSTTASTGSELTIEYYNGSAWVNVSVTDLPTGTGTDGVWYQKTLSTSLPNTVTQIRFTRTTTGPEFRIDDIKIF